VQQIFESGEIPEEMTWSILVLIPKASGGNRGIGLLEIMWKVISSIINTRLQESIPFHETLHGFRKGHGTGAASLDAKLQMQLSHIRSVPLYQLFLDLSKAYDTLDQTRTLQLLQGYGIGERILHLLTNFWTGLKVVARQQGYHGEPFRSERGTTQGDIISPTIFNVVVDAVIRTWHHKLETHGIADMVKAVFYADDGHFYSTNADALQLATDLIVELFECMGLQTNPTKTKIMICAPQPHSTRICTPVYKRRMAGTRETNNTYSARKRQHIECDICRAMVQERSLSRHKRFKHGVDTASTSQQAMPPHLTGNGTIYEISMPDYKQAGQCPVPGCNTIIKDQHGMRRHFLF
jgi:hypothetical protein